MSAKLIVLLIILVAGVVGHQYKAIYSQPCITLVEDNKHDSSKH